MSLLKFEYLKNAEMKRVVPVNGVKIVDKNGYIGADMTEYFPHQPYMNYVNYALVLTGPNYSKTGLGQVEFIDSEYLVNIGGRDYKTCTIGGMVWLAENLDYKFNVNGTRIPLNPSDMPSTPAAWYIKSDEAQYGIDGLYKAGLMYNWYAVDYLEQNKSTIIPGWHVPSVNEYNTLLAEIKNAAPVLMARQNSIKDGWPGSTWTGTDTYGFFACPHGSIQSNSSSGFGGTHMAWTSSRYNAGVATSYYFRIYGGMASTEYMGRAVGAPIRLVKDAT